MHPFHDYIARSLAEKLREWRTVVWYDPRAEFMPFIGELRGQPGAALPDSLVDLVQIHDQSAALCCYAGSFFAVRAAVEPLVAFDQPGLLLIYVPRVTPDERRSVLLELEKGGATYAPQLKRLARNVLRQFYSDGVIDELLAAERLGYQDIVALVANAGGDGKTASVLKLIFPQSRDNATLIAAWLADPDSDAAMIEKAATLELYKLIGSRLGLSLDLATPLAGARSRLFRYLLVGEFRADLSGSPPLSISMIPAPAGKEPLAFLRDVVAALRGGHATTYIDNADRIAAELSLASAGIAATNLGTIDTFRFEERVLLEHCDAILAQGDHAQAIRIAAVRQRTSGLIAIRCARRSGTPVS